MGAVNASNTATNVFAAHAWPPEVGGALIGILQIIALSTLDDSIGSSSSYSTIVSQLVRLCPSRGPQYKYMDAASKLTAGNLWQVIYVCFGIFGAFVSSLASNSLGQVAGVTPMAAFAGGFIMLFGSRLGAGHVRPWHLRLSIDVFKFCFGRAVHVCWRNYNRVYNATYGAVRILGWFPWTTDLVTVNKTQ